VKCECSNLWHAMDKIHSHDQCPNEATTVWDGKIRKWNLCADCFWINSDAARHTNILRILRGDLGREIS
jgi:hypothetical protein